MDYVKKYLIIVLLIAIAIPATGQQNFSRTLEAFQKSYLAEASGDLSLAVREMRAVYDETSYEINLRLGWLTYSAGQFNESHTFYSRAVQLKPLAIEPKFGLAYPLAAMGNWDQVIKQYRDILAVAPGNTVAMHRLGLIYYGRNDFAEAEKLFLMVVNLFPFDYDALLMLGWTYYNQRKFREARVLFSKALLNNPGGTSAMEGIKLLE
jgi:tetratricopeptide (TPR) repeat protein